jgi:hypothetical protein
LNIQTTPRITAAITIYNVILEVAALVTAAVFSLVLATFVADLVLRYVAANEVPEFNTLDSIDNPEDVCCAFDGVVLLDTVELANEEPSVGENKVPPYNDESGMPKSVVSVALVSASKNDGEYKPVSSTIMSAMISLD